ncbi:hypothetical protein B0T20DRAFT_226533 [Sordaria brevicollis]|uniref:Uncharacterized protein n=1 Tax=Sordaria brevicollis TaxID=83679 RepID=A0AAE0UB61_SORBR|nr:hypothetical protein B0T20DRAFT_226533 [Sordaria brevicollis]
MGLVWIWMELLDPLPPVSTEETSFPLSVLPRNFLASIKQCFGGPAVNWEYAESRENHQKGSWRDGDTTNTPGQQQQFMFGLVPITAFRTTGTQQVTTSRQGSFTKQHVHDVHENVWMHERHRPARPAGPPRPPSEFGGYPKLGSPVMVTAPLVNLRFQRAPPPCAWIGDAERISQNLRIRLAVLVFFGLLQQMICSHLLVALNAARTWPASGVYMITDRYGNIYMLKAVPSVHMVHHFYSLGGPDLVR